AMCEDTPFPAEIVKDQRYAFIRPDSKMLGPRYKFAKYGKCGAELSEMLPHLATVVDDIAIVKSMHTDQFNHAPAQIFLSTGSPLPGRPCIGSWGTYRIGSGSSDPPAFVVLNNARRPTGRAARPSYRFL